MMNKTSPLLVFVMGLLNGLVSGDLSSRVTADDADKKIAQAAPRQEAVLYRKLAIPERFLTTQKRRTFGGDIRIGDLNGDGR